MLRQGPVECLLLMAMNSRTPPFRDIGALSVTGGKVSLAR